MPETLQNLATLVATLVGTYVAFGGLEAWKKELTGKRDIELCQKVIELFYEAEHKMNALRSPISYSDEGATRAKEEGETPKETDHRNHLFTPLARWNSQTEFWSELFSYKFRVRALFGDKAVEAFTPIDEAVRSFRAAAVTRYQVLYRDAEGLDKDTRRGFERTIWAGHTPDLIADQMKQGIRLMEEVCIPLVRSTRPLNTLRRLRDRLRLF